MTKIVISGIFGIVLCCLAYLAFRFFVTSPKIQNEATPGSGISEFKSDFLSFPIFESGKVSGYLSFRVVISIKDMKESNSATIYATDVFNRNLPYFNSIYLSSRRKDDAISKMKLILKNLLLKEFGKKMIGDLDLVDIAYDQRLH